MEVRDKPFETNFAQLPPSRPSIGAHEYVDDEVDVYMSRRWPKCAVVPTENLIRGFGGRLAGPRCHARGRSGGTILPLATEDYGKGPAGNLRTRGQDAPRLREDG